MRAFFFAGIIAMIKKRIGLSGMIFVCLFVCVWSCDLMVALGGVDLKSLFKSAVSSWS